MGKYFAGLILTVVALFALEWFGIVDIPYLDLPDLTAGKQNLMHQTEGTVGDMG